MKVVRYISFWILLLSVCLPAMAQEFFSGRVVDASTREPVIGAAVTQDDAWALTDTLGRFTLKVRSAGTVTITSLGYKTFRGALLRGGEYRLQPDVFSLQEVVVTATENHGLTSSTKIGTDAISHIQPSSIADVLELLPGGTSRDPAFSAPQIVNLRAAGSLSSDYVTSALGTQFTIDGKPVGNNANLQYTPGWSNLGSDFVNEGTDMRTISTEDIETVDVVRGIASVEHGDLTSGLIQIKRIKGGHDLRLRFKSDMKSKLLYAGKGWEWGGKDRATLNASVNFLDSRADPRNPRQNYKRLTSSIRGGKTWSEGLDFTHVLNVSLDYTGSFDDRKSDQDIDEIDGIPAETYRSTYHRLALGADYTFSPKDREGWLRSVAVTGSLSYERDLIDRWKNVILSSETPLSISRDPGESDVVMIPARYEATLQVDGRPLYAYLNAVARFHAGIHDFKAGAEWTVDKNYGQGSVFDVQRPLSTSMSTRPRAYSDIPAEHQLSLFAEENARVPLGAFALEWMAGVRLSSLLGAGSGYTVNGKPYLDPRANLRLSFPERFPLGYRLEAGLYGGVGMHTKFPTMDMLFPDRLWGDRQQLNYWPVEKELRRINVLVYTIDPTNRALDAARNLKWEIGADASWNGWSASVDFFIEDMTSGFRNGSEYTTVIAKDYDENAIDKQALAGPPSLENLPYVLDTNLVAYGLSTNGSRTLKKGVEYTLATRRLPVVNTRLTVNGAWFRTEYMNSQPEYYRPSVIVNGEPYPYIGIYEKNDGMLYESLNTNFLFDTQVPRLGLIFSTAFQCTWFTGQQSAADDSMPVAYLDKSLVRHAFTEASNADGVLHQMVRQFSSSLLEYRRIPFLMNVNLKVMKKLYHDQVSCSLFVNRLFTLAPDYTVNDVLKRRSSTPYFGMELSFRL